MAVFKCKMCGGCVEFEPGATVGVCDSCGTKQTLPRLDDDKRANLYDRANHFRRNNDYDKAMGIYEKILNEDPTDAEAYWSLVLCRYGIEYIEDPATHKRIPTVNRAQYTSVFDDDNYKLALQYADGYQKSIYENEAETINEIQKGILEISHKEEPFDVFICYKETDADGRRTQDSVLANDLYHQLTGEGFKVFFSRITLEDKLGTAYEPYIFAALNSAKVMVVLGTKPEYFNAVWVKNEWSRYLTLIRGGAEKILIPAYRDMDPYDLPEEFSHLQAQDMSKLGFMQDLIRGIQKLIQPREAEKAAIREEAVPVGVVNIEALLKRAFLFLEDSDWKAADKYCEKVLDMDPENARAYLGKLLAEYHIRTFQTLTICLHPFDESSNYQKILRFGDEKLIAEVKGYNEEIKRRNEEERQNEIYKAALKAMESADTETAYKAASDRFKEIPGYKDADGLADQCLEKAEVCQKDQIYSEAAELMKHSVIKECERALEKFQSISGWRDAETQIPICQKKIEELKLKREEALRKREEQKAAEEKALLESKRKQKKFAGIAAIVVCIGIVVFFVVSKVLIPMQKRNEAQKLIDSGKYEEAYEILEKLGDSESQKNEIMDLEKSRIREVEIGSTITFGVYEQDNDVENGAEEIEWIVLEKQENGILLISKCALDAWAYDDGNSATWALCSLREWLNVEFVNEAFGKMEKNLIQSTELIAGENPYYETETRVRVSDKIFLLSISEAEQYFKTDEERICECTDYAIAMMQTRSQGEEVSFDTLKNRVGNGYGWWLRTRGCDEAYAADVTPKGETDYFGYLKNGIFMVRPAMWIDIS